MPKSLDKIASHPIIAGKKILKHGGGIGAGEILKHGGGIGAGGKLTRSKKRLQEKKFLKEKGLRKIHQGGY